MISRGIERQPRHSQQIGQRLAGYVALSDNGGPLRPLSEIVVFRPEPPFLSNCAAMCDSSGLTAMADGPIECILNRSLGFWRNLIESPPCRIAKRTFVSGALLAWPQFCSR